MLVMPHPMDMIGMGQYSPQPATIALYLGALTHTSRSTSRVPNTSDLDVSGAMGSRGMFDLP